MFETIRKQVMLRIQVKKELISKWNGKLRPRIKEKVKVVEEMCKACEVGFAREGKQPIFFYNLLLINVFSFMLFSLLLGKFEVDHHGHTWILTSKNEYVDVDVGT